MGAVHDVGGRSGYGAPTLATPAGVEGSAFAARWEAAVFAMMRCLSARGVLKNSDQFRHAVERVDARAYFAHGYYGRWLGGLETLLVEAGELDRQTLDARVGGLARALGATQAHIEELLADANIASRPLPLAETDNVRVSPNPGSSVRYVSAPPQFSIGQSVKAVGFSGLPGVPGAPGGRDRQVHTRLPEYASGCIGEIVAWHGAWVLPDTNAHLGLEEPAHLYAVAFSAQALYGLGAERGVVVHLDLFEPYLVAH